MDTFPIKNIDRYVFFGNINDGYTPIFYHLDASSQYNLFKTCKYFSKYLKILAGENSDNYDSIIIGKSHIVVEKKTRPLKKKTHNPDLNVPTSHDSNHTLSAIGQYTLGPPVGQYQPSGTINWGRAFGSDKNKCQYANIISTGTNEIIMRPYSYMEDVIITGNNNKIIIPDFVILKNIIIIGNNLDIKIKNDQIFRICQDIKITDQNKKITI